MEFKGTVKDIIFHSQETGYVVGRLKHDAGLITFTGTLPWIFEGQLLRLCGEMVEHPSFGSQLRVDSAEEILPQSREGVEKYLSSGVISGIGPVTARRMVAKFGLEIFQIMDHDMDKLLQVEGIGQKKLAIIQSSYEKSREVRNIMVFLQSYGVTPSQCMKIYYRYGQNSIAVVRENPYVLCEDISSIGFRTADRIAMNLGIETDSPFRIQSGLKFVLNSFSNLGNTCMPLEKLLSEAAATLGVPADDVLDNLRSLVLSEGVMVDELNGVQCAFTPAYWKAEISIARQLLTMAAYPYGKLSVAAEEFIQRYEEEQGIALHALQKEAISGVQRHGAMVITGGPGTGKTTIIKCILALLKASGLKVLMAAPTGRAAKRMTETTGEESRTIHRLLDLGVSDEGESFGAGEELEADCVIIDEASMIDVTLMNNLLKALKEGTRLILVGDADQLPSVGPGRVLSDIIEGGACKVVRLEMIFRQGRQSLITLNAHRINAGEAPLLNQRDGDFFFMSARDGAETRAKLIELIATRLPRFHQEWDPLKDIQVLSPMRKGELGINLLNEELKQVLNPKGALHKFTEFSQGDKVMQNRNNYGLKSRASLELTANTFQEESGVFNGDVGFVARIDEEDQIVTVLYDGERYVDYTQAELDDLELAFAITIHKSQGSEFPVVVIPLYMGPPMLMNRNLIYTAVTRARQMVVLLGSQRALSYMIANNRSLERYTSLACRFRKALEPIE